MADIKQELDRIKGRISDASFLANKGLSNEVGIHVFKYAPQHELIVRDYIDRLIGTPSDDYRIIERDMYQSSRSRNWQASCKSASMPERRRY